MVASDLYYDVAYNGELEQSDVFPPLFHFFILLSPWNLTWKRWGGRVDFSMI